jgi:O-antigen biosynthesis protein
MDNSSNTSGRVDIIVPVYRNLALSRRCVESVLAHTNMSTARLVVINDASPEPELAHWCSELQSSGKALLLSHEHNEGFVVSVNAGMALSESHDVVLLNSDTEVPAGWLERLREAAGSADDIATVTPFSNNGSICSYPHFCRSSPLPQGLDSAALDALFAQANRGKVVDLPTAVGFCMYIRRSALQRCGLFDAERYGRGYGEENDFSLRVAQVGLRNVLCADLFVYHEGAASFGDDRIDLMANAENLLVDRYPQYPQLVTAFVANDPLRPLRDAVDTLRLAIDGQARELQQEWQDNREYMWQRQQQLQESCDQYLQLLDNLHVSSRQQVAEYEKRCAQYETLLAETRAAFGTMDEAMAGQQQQLREALLNLGDLTQQHEQTRQEHEQTRQALIAAEQELDRMSNLPVIRFGRRIKLMLKRP